MCSVYVTIFSELASAMFCVVLSLCAERRFVIPQQANIYQENTNALSTGREVLQLLLTEQMLIDRVAYVIFGYWFV